MDVSILALTLFTPECPSGYIRRGLHTQKFIAEKNQYVTFTSTIPSSPQPAAAATAAAAAAPFPPCGARVPCNRRSLSSGVFSKRDPSQSERRFALICKPQRCGDLRARGFPLRDAPRESTAAAARVRSDPPPLPSPEISISRVGPFDTPLHHAREHVASWH
jgi:hypothetical protein